MLGTRASWQGAWRGVRWAAAHPGQCDAGADCHPIDVQRAIVVHSDRMRADSGDTFHDAAATRPDRTHRARIRAGRGTREDWLQMVASWARRDLFSPAGYGAAFPHRVYLSVGFPLGTRKAGKRTTHMGQCWARGVSRDNRGHILICPTLETYDAAETLLHELVHDTVGVAAGHGPIFRECALGIGFKGPMRLTPASETLTAWIQERIAVDWPAYPHGVLRFGPDGRPIVPLGGIGVPTGHPGGGTPSTGPGSGSRLKKVSCQCGYVMRVTRKWLDVAIPECPVCKTEMSVEG